MDGEGDQGQADTGIVERTAGGSGALSAMEAARSLVDSRNKRPTDEQPGEVREAATPEPESASQEADTAREDGPGETAEVDGAAEQQPPVEPPRSWTKEDKELFRGLPRETQERLADREQSRERDFLKRQSEAAEKLKGLTVQQQAAEQARQQYEQTLPLLMEQLQGGVQGEFADIKTVDDVERMAREDWPRFNAWQARQMKIAAVQEQMKAAKDRESQDAQLKWKSFEAEQDALFFEKAPDLTNKDAHAKAAKAAGEMLNDLGFPDAELNRLYYQGGTISFRDHRVQLLLRDAVKYREARTGVKTAVIRPVPQVQRPGVAQPRGADSEGRIKDLTERLNRTGNAKDAAALLVAQRQARAGR